ncbi:hypothetical protein A2U01_0047350, partial [Trifolium medium]|nr:hypothetical protein [Trifolium medium]
RDRDDGMNAFINRSFILGFLPQTYSSSFCLPAVDGLVGICAVLDSDAIESVRFVLALA